MEQKKRIWIGAGGAALLALGGWYMWSRHSQQPAQAPAPEPVAVVSTQRANRQPLPITVTGYGEVTTGQVDTVSFPRAGQVSRLLVVPGQRVARGTPLASLNTDPTVLTSYQQALNAAGLAQRELTRVQELYSLQLATQSQVDNARKALEDARTALTAQRKLGGEIVSGSVTAPFDGVVTAVSVALGDRIQAGTSILQLGHLDSLRVQVGLEPSDARLVRKGMRVDVVPLQDEKETVPGEVVVAQDMLDPKTQLFDVIVVLPPWSARVLVPGTRVRASIATGSQEAWVLPRQAVLSDDQGSYVFQVVQGRAHRIAVHEQQDGGKEVGVSGPIQPNLPVVVLGNYELQDGMKVREATR